MDKSLLWVTLPLFGLAAWALAKGIAHLRAAIEIRELANLPLAANGAVDFSAPGEVVLWLCGRLGRRDFAGLSFALRDAQGRAVESTPIIVRSSRTDIRLGTKLAVRRFRIPAAGRYTLAAEGFDAAKASAHNRLVIAQPSGWRATGAILWVVAAALTLLVSLVFSAVVVFAAPSVAAVVVVDGANVLRSTPEQFSGCGALPNSG